MESIKAIPTAELVEIINQYPWFNAARVELCRRKVRTGEAGCTEAALYIGSRALLYKEEHTISESKYWDKDVEDFLRKAPERKVKVVGGDFFSQDEYDDVVEDGDNVLANIATKIIPSKKEAENNDIIDSFCTETLAEIYADQGYYEQAKYIYSKLILLYPEKNAYFATLIGKLDELEKN